MQVGVWKNRSGGQLRLPTKALKGGGLWERLGGRWRLVATEALPAGKVLLTFDASVCVSISPL